MKALVANGKREGLRARRERVRGIILGLSRLYPNAGCALIYHSPLQLLVAVILSAQCTDVRVNQVTPFLFARFPDVEALAAAELAELEELIKSTGFFRHKARNIKTCCRQLRERHGGRLPAGLEEMVALAGVGRKTANVVLGEIKGLQGIVVDTHVKRLSRRLRLTGSSEPVRIERDLEAVVPEMAGNLFSHLLIYHGRQICTARGPRCRECPILKLCPGGLSEHS
ncbi:MAG: endonuclease III [Deltaproteobacteria bacterium]|nr:endonuclease III [Deltaproteobacteria bacterium]